MTAPALWVAVTLVAGVVAGAAGVWPLLIPLTVVVAAWGSAGVALWRGAVRTFAAATCIGCLATGITFGAVAAREAANASLLSWYHTSVDADRPAHAVALLREDAARGASGITLSIDITIINGLNVAGGARVAVTGAIATEAAPAWRAGRTVAMDVLLREPLDYRDPGVPSDRERLARQGIVLIGSVKSAALISLVARGSPLAELAAALRARVRTATAAAVGAWSPRSAGVVTAILIGDRSGLNADDERRLQDAGTYHVIAISGGNIALLTALLVMAGRAARLPVRSTAAVSMLLLAFYGYAAGLAPSVLRATLAGVIYLAARAADHRGGALNALAVAAACASAAAPLTILDPGFVLSFGATGAIVAAAGRLVPAMPHDRSAGAPRAAVRRILSEARTLCAATICAEIALAPVGARFFGRVSLAGLVLNFAAIPLMSVIQVAGLAAVAAAAVSIRLAIALGWIAHVGTAALMRSAALVDVAPWLVLDVPPPAAWLMASWYAAWGCLLFVTGPRLRRTAWVVVCASALVMLRAPVGTAAYSVPAQAAGWTRVVFFDVGQGDATLVWPAGARPFLVDAGGVPGGGFDVGRRVTVPAAWAFGVRRLGPLVLTHGDPDHIGGAPAVLRALRPDAVWEGVPVSPHVPLTRLRDAADRAAIPWVEVRSGDVRHVGGAEIRVLNPPEPDWERQKVRNDDSIVIELRVGDVAFLLPGDITRTVEPLVAALIRPVPIVIVKAPHHGSAGSSSQVFIDPARPSAVVFSAGRRNPFGHPAPVVVDRYRAAGAKVFSTADDGAVVVDTDGHQVVVWTWTGRREMLVPVPVPAPVPTANHKGH
jgi:competence protein ComEC